MSPVIATFELKLDPHSLPLVSSNLALRFAIRESGLHGLNEVPELSRHHSEKKNYALFIDRLVAQTPKVDGISVGRAVTEGRMFG